MKAFLALTFLAALSLAAGVDFKDLKPLDVVMPVNPRYTAQEWQEIYAAQVPSPEINPSYKKGTEPQPEFAGKVHVPLDEQANRITGGSVAARGQFPWQVALIINNSGLCGGSVISNRWILTAAHCTGNTYTVILGANRRDQQETGSLRVTASTTIRHAQYNPNNLNNDIAVIQLPSAVTFTTFISPIRLRSIAGNLAGSRVRVSGWGRTSDASNAASNVLNFVDLTVITNAQCANTFGNIIIASTLCCATSNGQSTCNGDSGGALFGQESDGIFTQVGIVSFGASGGCTRGFPVGFARVNSFLSWISSSTGLSFN